MTLPPFPPNKEQPGQPGQPEQKPKSDGSVESYERIVNGKVVKVNGFKRKDTSTSRAVGAARMIPGRPRMAGKPGSYAGGRDIPGVLPVTVQQPIQQSPTKGNFNEPGKRNANSGG